MKEKKLVKTIPWYWSLLYGVIVLAVLAGTFLYPYHFLMKTEDLPNIEAMQNKKDQQGEKILYDVEKLPKGTYCTARSNDLDGVPLYQNAGDTQAFCLLPEGKYVTFVDNAVANGQDWGQVSYCGLEGWLPMKHLTFLSESQVAIEKDSIVYINADTALGMNVYAEASSSGEVVREGLHYGEELVVKELKDGWGLVSLRDPSEAFDDSNDDDDSKDSDDYDSQSTDNSSKQEMGWINMYHVGSYGKEDVNFWRVTLFGTAEGLNLRYEPNAEAKRLLKIPDQEILIIREYRNGWGFVEYDGQEGWVMLRYMTPCPAK